MIQHNNIIDFYKFPIKCMIGLLYFLPLLKKTKRTIPVLVVDFVICSFILYIMNAYIYNKYGVAAFLPYAIVYCVFIAIAYFAFENSGWTILFCAGIILATQQIAFNIWILFYAYFIYAHINSNSIYIQLLMYIPEVLVCVAVFAFIYHLFLKKIYYHDEIIKKKKSVIFIVCILMFSIFILFQVMQHSVSGWNTYMYAYIYVLVACIFADGFLISVFYENKMKNDLVIMQQIMNQKEAQYNLSKNNIELINQKCHDMKYILKTIELSDEKKDLQEIVDNIGIYDAIQKTGNEIMDVVLTEYNLMCEKNSIDFTAIVDGKILNCMVDIDIYSLFGNILENAVEACMQVEDCQKRYIILKVVKKGKIISIHQENISNNAISMKYGAPITTKNDTDYHGFGTKSIKYIVEKYEGGVSFQVKKNIFVLDIFIPISN